jgi:hypothetical protein
MAKYYNPKRMKGPSFERGDKVYLVRRNIKTKRPSDKLDHKKLGPFTITKVISNSNYELRLPSTMKIHPVFHISLLEPAPANSELKETIIVDAQEGEYDVEKILSSRQNGTVTEYLVKWLDYPETENTWEPMENLRRCSQMLEQYHRENTQPATTRNPAQTHSSRLRRRHP